MEIKKIEIQDSNGNVYYPHTYSDVTFIKNASNNFKGETVEEALNELFQFADDGKKSIANVIGSPLSATDTFEKMLIKIGSLKNDMAANIRNKNQTANGTESLQSLINKIGNIDTSKYNKVTGSFSKNCETDDLDETVLTIPKGWKNLLIIPESLRLDNFTAFSNIGMYISANQGDGHEMQISMGSLLTISATCPYRKSSYLRIISLAVLQTSSTYGQLYMIYQAGDTTKMSVMRKSVSIGDTINVRFKLMHLNGYNHYHSGAAFLGDVYYS